MSDFPHWDAAETFSGQEIAALVVGVDPLDPQATLWRAQPVLERIREGYRIGRNFVTHTMTKEHFSFMRTAWKEGLVSVLVSYFPIMQQEAWPMDQDRPFVFPRRVAGPEGEFEVQRFDRAEIHRWLSAVGMKSIYQFCRKQLDYPPAPEPQTSPVDSGRKSVKTLIPENTKGGLWNLDRLIEKLPLPDQLSVTTAADVLGGTHWVDTIMQLVEIGNWSSWTHSPAQGEQREYINRTLNSRHLLPRVTPETNPAKVMVEGEEVLWRWCVEYEQLLQGVDSPSKESIEERLKFVNNLIRSRALAAQDKAVTASLRPMMAVSASSDAEQIPDPERRLARLRALGGTARYVRCEWKFTGMVALINAEKADGRKRNSEKTIRADLKQAAQSERDEKTAGFATGLGKR